MPNEKLRCFSSPFIWFCFSLIFFFEECPVELGISKLSNSFLETFADLGRFRGLNHIGKKSLSVFLICSWFITYLDMTLYSQYIYIYVYVYIYIYKTVRMLGFFAGLQPSTCLVLKKIHQNQTHDLGCSFLAKRDRGVEDFSPRRSTKKGRL